MPAFRITQDARSDIIDVLRYTELKFGKHARRNYQGLLQAAFESLAEQPDRIGSIARDELAQGLRSLHLFHCRSASATGRMLRPRHVVFYRQGSNQVIEIIRILHDAMEVERHLPPE